MNILFIYVGEVLSSLLSYSKLLKLFVLLFYIPNIVIAIIKKAVVANGSATVSTPISL